MSSKTNELDYQIENICVDCLVPQHALPEKEAVDFLKCVTCPFCKETVNAIVTEHSIECPSCKVSVKR